MNVDIFVYGTLKRGECRQDCWPHQPVRVQEAFVRGLLYDLGPYPALIAGDDWVLGEVWTIAAADRLRTLDVLDKIEGYAPDGKHNLYDRVEVAWFAEPNDETANGKAMVYHFARLNGLRKLQPMRPRPISPYTQPIAFWPPHRTA